MIYGYNKAFVKKAKELRKHMTQEEKHLWYDFLKRLPITVNRQKNIGNFIVDFYISSKNLVIEIDGAQHEMEENEKKDDVRDAELKKLGITVLRYKNSDIRYNFEEVCEDILKHTNLSASDLKPN